MNHLTGDFDYIVVGAGSSGSAIAYRLAQEANMKILLIEYGGKNSSVFIDMPAALSYPMNMKKYNWGFDTEPEPNLFGRSLICPRGKGLGGSSTINGMIYVRGHPQDFDSWSAKGASGWSFADVLPYFKKMESYRNRPSPWRGKDGPIHIKTAEQKNVLHHVFSEAVVEAGYSLTDDYNGYKQEGIGAAQMTVYEGKRWSAAKGYLDNITKQNICIMTSCLVDKLLFSNSKCNGVIFKKNSETFSAKCKKGVILAAGSIGNPCILQRSGIGSSKHLADLGIKPFLELKGVGNNLQDHLELYFQVKCKKPVTLYRNTNFLSKAKIFLEWYFFQKGLGASNQFETLGFLRTDRNQKYPNLQYHFLPLAINYDGSSPHNGHGFQFHVGTMRSKSRGSVSISNSDPAVHPSIKFNYLNHPDDLRDFRNAIKITRNILNQAAFKDYADGEIQPSSILKTNRELDQFIRTNVESAFHPCGTCKMGHPDDKDTVVTPDCKINGLDNLFCADASVFPSITNGNLNAPSIMVGEKAVDHILDKALLPKENLIPYN